MATASTYLLKGFLVDEALVSTVTGSVSQFGQLSDFSRTFSTTKSTFTNEATDVNIRYESFYSVNNTGANTPVPADAAAHVLAVGAWVYGRVAASTIANEAAPFTNFITQFVAQFSVGNLSVTNVSVNALVASTQNAGQYCPDYIQWTATDSANSNAVYTFKVWFIDASFRNQYDQFQIVVVPPFTPVDGFNDTQANVNLKLAAQTVAGSVAAINVAVGNNPPTAITTQTYNWFEPTTSGGNGNISSSTTWSFVVYGPLGLHTTNLANAVVAYLENPTNTALSASQWQAMFPSVFQAINYFIVPLWNRIVEVGPTPLFSPMTNYGNAMADVQSALPSSIFSPTAAPQSFFNQYLYGTTSVWQDLFFWIIGAPTNSNSDYDFHAKFPDYLNVGLTDPNAAKMSAVTTGFVQFLETLLSTALTLTLATPQSSLPSGIQTTTINGLFYAEGAYNGISYLAITKGSYTGT